MASGITLSVRDKPKYFPHADLMLGKNELLAALRAKGIRNAEIARVLGLAPPRVTEIYKGERGLSLDEGKLLFDSCDLDESANRPDPLNERVARLLVLHVALALDEAFDPADERVAGVAQDLRALIAFAGRHDSELSEEAANGFLNGAIHARSGVPNRPVSSSRTKARNRRN